MSALRRVDYRKKGIWWEDLQSVMRVKDVIPVAWVSCEDAVVKVEQFLRCRGVEPIMSWDLDPVKGTSSSLHDKVKLTICGAFFNSLKHLFQSSFPIRVARGLRSLPGLPRQPVLSEVLAPFLTVPEEAPLVAHQFPKLGYSGLCVDQLGQVK